MEPEIVFLNVKQVCRIACLSRAAIYRKLNQGKFPKPFYVGERSPRWRSDVVNEWMESVSAARAA